MNHVLVGLQVETILVMGHSRCGGIKGLMSCNDDGTTTTYLSYHIYPYLIIFLSHK